MSGKLWILPFALVGFAIVTALPLWIAMVIGSGAGYAFYNAWNRKIRTTGVLDQ